MKRNFQKMKVKTKKIPTHGVSNNVLIKTLEYITYSNAKIYN